MDVVDWLLAGDPAVRWQVLRDLTDADTTEVARERARVATEGWGARLLAARDRDGLWAGGACFPAPGRAGDEPGQPWTATFPSLDLLRLFGLDPRSDQAREAVRLVAANCRWEHAGQPYFAGEVEPCINGRTLAQGAYFGVDVAGILDRLLRESLPDGGWNCEAENGSVRSSFHTTIDVLEGLRAYEEFAEARADVRAARERGEQYLLERGLFRRLSTGAVADEAFRQFSFPPQWYYDVLRALDHFAGLGARPDPRIGDAIDIVRRAAGADGRWPAHTHPGQQWFPVEAGDGSPSRWNTLRAMRVLRWAEDGGLVR